MLTRRIVLEVDGGQDPVTGRLVSPAGDVRPFVGYVQLVAAIEDLRGPPELDSLADLGEPCA